MPLTSKRALTRLLRERVLKPYQNEGNESTEFVFCHGFGFDASFWEPFISAFPLDKTHCVDLGYFGKPLPYIPRAALGPRVAVGHSLGLIKLMQLGESFSHFVGLGGFINFLGAEPILRRKRLQEMRALKQGLKRYPAETLAKFYKNCGQIFPTSKASALNLPLLMQDFVLLENAYSIGDKPLLILFTEDDVVVPKNIIYENFEGHSTVRYKSFSKGGHGFRGIPSSQIYQCICKFLEES